VLFRSLEALFGDSYSNIYDHFDEIASCLCSVVRSALSFRSLKSKPFLCICRNGMRSHRLASHTLTNATIPFLQWPAHQLLSSSVTNFLHASEYFLTSWQSLRRLWSPKVHPVFTTARTGRCRDPAEPSSCPVSLLRPTSLLSFHLHLGLSNDIFPTGFRPNFSMYLSFLP
jgi:hypothetical protein